MKSYYEWECEGERGVKDLSDYDLWPFFRIVGRVLAFDDCSPINITKIVYDGREFRYVGWQPDMKFEFVGVGDGSAESYVVWLPECDH